MPLFTQSALLKALGWTLFNSLWQMGLCWLFYRLVVAVFKNSSPNFRHNLAIGLLGIGAIWSGMEFIAGYFAGIGSPAGSGFLAVRLYITEALPYCSSLYLLALAVLLVRYSNHYFYSRRLKYTGLSKMQPELRVFTETMSQRISIRQPVQAWLSSLVDVPLTLGFFKPVILLPVAMVNNLTLQQTEAILLHELAHIRRNDYLLNLGVTVLELLFFFNPFSRLLIVEVKREREHRCDDWVMQFSYDPRTYVSALLSLATPAAQRPSLALAATGGGNDRLLLQRVRRILQQNRNGDHFPGRSFARPFILLLFTLLVTLTGEKLERPPAANLSMSKQALATIRLTVFRATWAAQKPSTVRLMNIPLPAPAPAISVPPAVPPAADLVNIAQPITAPASREFIARVATRKPRPAAVTTYSYQPARDLAGAGTEENEEIMMTSGDAIAPATETYAAVVHAEPENREYSINNGPSLTLVPVPENNKMTNENLPFVPSSSFSIQYMEDSTRPVEQLAYWQLYSRQEFATTVKKLQQDLVIQLRRLQQKQAGNEGSPRPNTLQFQKEQLKLQQQYLLKLEDLQKKLEKAGRRLKIVYI